MTALEKTVQFQALSRRTAPAAQEPHSQENWHPLLADCFQVFGTDRERLLPAKLKVSFPTFR